MTGGAESFEVPPALLTEIKRGLISAGLSKDAWIVTGGTNVGVMKLVGECVKSSQAESTIPLIGICTCTSICCFSIVFQHASATFDFLSCLFLVALFSLQRLWQSWMLACASNRSVFDGQCLSRCESHTQTLAPPQFLFAIFHTLSRILGCLVAGQSCIIQSHVGKVM